MSKIEKVLSSFEKVNEVKNYIENTHSLTIALDFIEKDQRIAELEKENDELKMENNEFCEHNKKLREEKQTAVKEFAEELKLRQNWFCNGQIAIDHFNEELEELLKERGIE